MALYGASVNADIIQYACEFLKCRKYANLHILLSPEALKTDMLKNVGTLKQESKAEINQLIDQLTALLKTIYFIGKKKYTVVMLHISSENKNEISFITSLVSMINEQICMYQIVISSGLGQYNYPKSTGWGNPIFVNITPCMLLNEISCSGLIAVPSETIYISGCSTVFQFKKKVQHTGYSDIGMTLGLPQIKVVDIPENEKIYNFNVGALCSILKKVCLTL